MGVLKVLVYGFAGHVLVGVGNGCAAAGAVLNVLCTRAAAALDDRHVANRKSRAPVPAPPPAGKSGLN